MEVKKKRKSLQRRVVLSILLVCIFSWVIGLIVVYISGKKAIENSIGSTFKELALETGKKVDLIINNRIYEIKTLSSLELIRSAVEKANLEKGAEKGKRFRTGEGSGIFVYIFEYSDKGLADYLKGLMASDSKEYLLLTDEKGRLVASTRDLPRTDFSEETWWKSSFTKKDIYIGDIRYDEIVGGYSLTMSYPVMKDGVLRGVLSISRSTDLLFNNVILVKVGKTDHTMLASSDGKIIFCPVFPPGTHLLDRLTEAIFKESPGWTITTSDVHYPGKNSINGFAPVGITFSGRRENFGGKRWYIFTSQDPSETYAPIRILFKWVTLTGLLGTLTLTFLGIYLTRRIIDPVRELHEGMKVIGEGDLGHRLDIKTGDEIEDLADGFNDMVGRIARHEGELEKVVEERTRELKEVHEELLRKERLAVMGQMAGGVAHEIKNPLAGIKGAIHFLRLKLEDADQKIKDYLDMMEQEINIASKIVGDLLGFSRMRPPDRQEISVGDLISGALESNRPPDNIRVRIDLEDGLPPVYVDKVQIRQVFLNIISNAFHSMQNGGELIIRAVLKEAGSVERFIDVSFADTGCGIPKENIDKIFQPLFTTKMKGIGLGLAVSKMFIEANGGRINAESEEGRGTTFTASLPSSPLSIYTQTA